MTLDLSENGKLHITRASHVEPDRNGFWWADMGPVGGPVLGPFKNRTEALQAETAQLSEALRMAVVYFTIPTSVFGVCLGL